MQIVVMVIDHLLQRQQSQTRQMNYMNIFEKNEIHVEKGIFGADMKVSLLNDGPVTVIIEK